MWTSGRKVWATCVALISMYVGIGLTCLVFKTMCVDRRIPLREGTFLNENDTFPPLTKRNIRDKAKGLCITSARYIGALGVRYLIGLYTEQLLLGWQPNTTVYLTSIASLHCS